ncbi:PAS domain S-box protein [Rhizobium sp. RAF56]|uniref:PAS domain S-box protein n=1 Tax=Rhizobium sp. RAF56 TaxID=3233062 RepID=UPI003F9CB70F
MTHTDLPFLAGGGKLASLIATFDWAGTSLGAIDGWSQILKTTVAILLRSPVPIVTLWGEDGIMIYNDAYSEFAGARHPKLLGSKVREGWPEVADFNDNVMRVGLAGRTLAYRDQELKLFREGRSSHAWLNLDYSPILGEDGTPVGVMAIVIETTEKVRAEQWRNTEQDRLKQMFAQAPGFMAMMHGREHVFDLVNQAYMQLVGHRDIVGLTVREALPDLEGQAYFELLDRVYETGTTYTGKAMAVDFQLEADGRLERKFVDLVYQPVVGEDGKVVGIFAQGTDVTDRVTAEEALRASELQGRQILDSAVDYAIIALDLNGKILRWNEGAHRLFGWTQSEVAGLDWDMLFTAEDRAAGKAKEAMEAAFALGTAHHERWHVRKSGAKFWANGEISPLRDQSGTPIGLVKVLRDQTAAHLATQALQAAEARLRRAQEAGGVGVFSVNLDESLVSATPEFCKIFGIAEANEVPTGLLEDLVLEEDREMASNPQSRKEGSGPLSTEYRIRRADNGEKRVIARKGEFEFDDNARPVRFVGVVQDVTDRRKAQRELRESEARFRALAQAMPNQVWTARADGELDWFNDRVYQYSGLAPTELKGNGWLAIVHPDDMKTTMERWKRALERGETYESEFRLRDDNGAFRWFIARAVPITDDEDKVRRWIGTNTDVEELRATREKLERLNETLEQRVAERTADRDRVWRLSTDIMLVADLDSTITAVNPAGESVFGWSEDELIGRSFMDLIHPDDRAEAVAQISRLQQGVRTFAFEIRYRTRAGSFRTISWTAVRDDAHIHAVGRDVSEERAAAATLRKTEAALQQAQKMEAIGNLTGGVAHDFNNLLQVVAGNLQLLGKDVIGNERAQRRITNALEGVDRGAKLAAQLLAFGRRQALDPRVVNIGRLVRGMDEMLRRTIGEGIEIETIVSGGLWNTLVDPMQIENALLNLAINARDAMDGFGKLTIEVGNAFIDDAYARLHEDAEPGQYVALSVTDTGGGMPPEIIDKVFEPFFSTKPEGKGTGLGLSMVYGFVKQTGGHVKVYSEVDSGTTVRLYLPRSVQQEDVEVLHVDMPVEGGKETILVAEDDEGVRATVVEMLQELGYRVLKAPDASAALAVIESGMAIDMLFTDVVMPGSLKSAELARKAKERLPDLAVLFTSGYTENSIVHEGRLDPGVQLLSKPYSRDALAHKLRQLLDGRRQKTAPAKADARPAPDAAVPDAKSVLVVEDEPLIRMATTDMLQELGYHVREAGSAEEALAMLEDKAASIIVSDLGLPGMSGENFCRHVRERWPETALVFATGKDDAPRIGNGSRISLLQKPFGIAEVKSAIERCFMV